MKWLVSFVAFFLLYSCRPRSMWFNKDGFHGTFYKSFEKMQQHGSVAAFYNFQSHQKVASVGAQTCVSEAIYASFCDSVDFYLEDIDTTYFTAAQAAYVWNYYGNLRGKPLTSTYQLVLGTEDATLLPAFFFDKCLIINSFHEFTRPQAMLKDIYSKLKPGGLLYIDEALPKKPGEKHASCRMLLYTPQEMDAIVCPIGFKALEGYNFSQYKGKFRRKIYQYQKI